MLIYVKGILICLQKCYVLVSILSPSFYHVPPIWDLFMSRISCSYLNISKSESLNCHGNSTKFYIRANINLQIPRKSWAWVYTLLNNNLEDYWNSNWWNFLLWNEVNPSAVLKWKSNIKYNLLNLNNYFLTQRQYLRDTAGSFPDHSK